MLVTALVLNLARPIEVIEEWTLVSDAPLIESVTARAIYRREQGPSALLPDAVQGGAPPVVIVPSRARALDVRRGTHGWEIELPPGDRAHLRVVARVVRPLHGTRLFKLTWPPLRNSDVPRRRIAMVPRAWLPSEPADWSCSDPVLGDLVSCVTTERGASTLVHRIPAPPTAIWARLLAWAAVLAAMLASSLAGRPGTRTRFAVGAGAGAAAGLCAALSLVGAHALGWPGAISVCGSLGAFIGAFAMSSPRSARVGALALAVLPLVAIVDGRPGAVIAVASISTVAIGVARSIGTSTWANETGADSRVSG